MLRDLFKEFCTHLDGKIKWAGKDKTLKTKITSLVFDFFEKKFSQEKGLIKTSPYMLIDAIWRYPKPQYTDEGIKVALEHEISKRKISDFLKEEIQRLIDIKAKYKIGIFYPPSEPDEKELKKGIEEKLKNSKYLAIPWEEYLFIFGKPSRKEGKNIILFKGLHYSYDLSDYRNLKITEFEPIIIKQKEQNELRNLHKGIN